MGALDGAAGLGALDEAAGFGAVALAVVGLGALLEDTAGADLTVGAEGLATGALEAVVVGGGALLTVAALFAAGLLILTKVVNNEQPNALQRNYTTSTTNNYNIGEGRLLTRLEIVTFRIYSSNKFQTLLTNCC